LTPPHAPIIRVSAHHGNRPAAADREGRHVPAALAIASAAPNVEPRNDHETAGLPVRQSMTARLPPASARGSFHRITQLITSSVIRKGFVVTHFLAPDRISAFLNVRPPHRAAYAQCPARGPKVPDRA
jgi:hypothetical protein